VTKPPQSSSGATRIVVKLVSQRGWLNDADLLRRLPGSTLVQGDIEFTTSPEADADVIVIQNYLRYDTELSARSGFIWKWDNEPIVNDSIDRGYDRVFTHLDIDDPRVSTAPPVLDWWVGKSYDELHDLDVPEKTRALSAIASTKDWITGHRMRGKFVERAAQKFPDMDLYGRGRELEIDDKWDGLATYRYSLAIENTSKDDYWTEKISDCFLSYTVPFYFGATNISQYFPEDSFIWLPIDDPERAVSVIHETLAHDEWKKRLPAIAEARRRVLEEYSLYAHLSGLIIENREQILSSPKVVKMVRGRRTRPGGWIRGAGVFGNLRARVERRNARRNRNN
jgi:hypothetical protein